MATPSGSTGVANAYGREVQMADLTLVTGGAGFIGGHLVAALVGSGRAVRVLDNLEPQVHEGHLPELDARAEFIYGDVVDPEVWPTALDGVNEVVHLAAAVGVGQSMYEIVRYCRANVMGTAYMLQALIPRRDQIRKLVVASSMSIYGEGAYRCPACASAGEAERLPGDLAAGRWEPLCKECGHELEAVPTREEKRLQPSSIYAVTKRDQEEMCLAFGRAYGIPTVALRFFNVYGPGQALGNPYTGVAAIFAARLLAGEPPLVFEDGRQRRDFVHVTDVATACVRALASRTSDVAINVGTGRPVSVLEVASALRAAIGGPAAEFLGSFRSGDVRHCFADVTKARDLLGWAPAVIFEEGMEDLARWLRNQRGYADRQTRVIGELRTHGLLR
ncbi:MAG: NAD-dependent epimerase/dehydratase family protein [Armatimonadota bacterium]|nr:NAD-dependent epimerase/dehydratase family protein [Armatimonadota bacterium]